MEGSGFRRRYFTTSDGAVVCSSGMMPQGKTVRGTVLLVHGYGQNHLTWHGESRSFCRHLAENGWHVEAVDLRGHGEARKRKPKLARSLADYLDHDLPTILTGILADDPPRPLVLMGHSVGGLLASYTALKRPGLFSALVVISSPGRMKFVKALRPVTYLPGLIRRVPLLASALRGVPFHLDYLGRFAALIVRHGGESLMPDKPKAWLTGSMEPAMVQERITDGFDRTGLGVVAELANWANTGKLRVEGLTEDLVRDFAGLELPVLLVSSPHDTVIPPSLTLRASVFSGAQTRTHVVDGFGHCDILLGTRAPEKIWGPVTRWLAGVVG